MRARTEPLSGVPLNLGRLDTETKTQYLFKDALRVQVRLLSFCAATAPGSSWTSFD